MRFSGRLLILPLIGAFASEPDSETCDSPACQATDDPSLLQQQRLSLAASHQGILGSNSSEDFPETDDPCKDEISSCSRMQCWGADRNKCAKTCGVCTPITQGGFRLQRFRNDQVENELAYAKTGSEVPEGLHGIWWMDQFATQLPIPGDESYPYNFPGKCDEFLVSWGEQTYDPKTRCLSPTWQQGGKKGVWTFNDQGRGQSNVWLGPRPWGFMRFCFTSDKFDNIDIYLANKLPESITPLLMLLGFKRVGAGYNGYWWLPSWIMQFKMVKKPWGWDRVTTAFTNQLPESTKNMLLQYCPPFLREQLSMELKEAHYPVFQVLDGNGKRTNYYEKYLEVANTDSPSSCTCTKGCGCPCMQNHGEGTSLVGRWSP